MGVLFGIKMLVRWEFLNTLMTILKNRSLEIASTKDFLSCSQPREMTATCPRMVVIKNLFSLVMGEALSENGIYTMSIQGIIKDKIVLCVVTNTSMILMRYSRLKTLCLEIND